VVTKTIVVVNRHRIRANKAGADDPVFRCSRGKYGKPWYEKEFRFTGSVKLVENREKPLPCGATVWLECDDS